MLLQFQFLHVHAPTLAPYILETPLVEMKSSQEDDTITGVEHILNTLTATQQHIYLLFLDFALDAEESSLEWGLTFAKVKEKAKQEQIQMTINDELIKQALRQFADHKIVKKKEDQGQIFYYAHYNKRVLVKIREFLRQKVVHKRQK